MPGEYPAHVVCLLVYFCAKGVGRRKARRGEGGKGEGGGEGLGRGVALQVPSCDKFRYFFMIWAASCSFLIDMIVFPSLFDSVLCFLYVLMGFWCIIMIFNGFLSVFHYF